MTPINLIYLKNNYNYHKQEDKPSQTSPMQSREQEQQSLHPVINFENTFSQVQFKQLNIGFRKFFQINLTIAIKELNIQNNPYFI